MYSKKDIQNIYFLTPMQEGMLFNYAMNEKAGSYLEQITFSIEGTFNFSAFKAALQVLVARYDVLRARFIYKNVKRPVQIVLKQEKIDINLKDISLYNQNDKEEFVKKFYKLDRENQFNLAKELPFRINIFQLSSKEYLVICSFHHIILDGWSVGILLREFGEIYGNLINNKKIELDETKPYSQYIKWLEKREGRENDLTYWKQYLKGYEQVAGIPKAIKNRQSQEYDLQQIDFRFSKQVTERLKKIAQQNGVTLSALFHTLWGVFLQKYNQLDDVVFGSVVSGRPSALDGIDKMVGLLINCIPIRVQADGSMPFSKLLKKVGTEVVGLSDFHFSPLSEIQANTALNRNLINHVIVFENYPLENIMSSNNEEYLGFNIKNIDAYEETDYDFNVVVIPEEELHIRFGYNALEYQESFVQRMKEHFQSIAETVSIQPNISIKDIDFVTLEEKEILKEEFQQVEYCKQKTIIDLFEKQVSKTPKNIAVQFENRKLTYAELNDKVIKLAKTLSSKGVQHEEIIGLMVEPSLEMIIGILGILKAGATFLPIDPTFVPERIKYMLSDTKAKRLLTQKCLEELLLNLNFQGEITYIDDEQIYKNVNVICDFKSKESDSAYIIYTSGTTGKPKGACISHKNVINYINWFTKTAQLKNEDRTGLLSSFSFDLGYTSLFSALLNGCQLHIIRKETYTSPSKLLEYIQYHRLSYLKLTPSLFSFTINDPAFVSNVLENVRLIVLGGEEINVKDIEKIYENCSHIQFMNHYGPTETTIGAIAQVISFDQFSIYQECPTIGKGIDNIRVYILDKQMNVLPKGITGEIYLAGDGLGKGYLNNEELNEQKFLQHTLLDKTERLYRTGDLGRYLEDGNIQFLGRVDSQVKIRGYRIETSEVEYHLRSLEAIAEASVIGKQGQDGISYLCAYVVLNKAVNFSELRVELSNKVPDYMIPSYFVQMDKIPLTPNGKVNRKLLPEPDSNIGTNISYEAPRNNIEEKLVCIWKDILLADSIGIFDDFFLLGGHSLKAMTLLSRIQKELEVEINLKQLFENPTIHGLAECISKTKKSLYSSIKCAERKDNYVVSSVQKRMYTLSQYDSTSVAYNIPIVMMIEGNIDVKRLEKALDRIIKRHDSLRTSFKMHNDQIVQNISKEVSFVLVKEVARSKDIQVIFNNFIKPFDLTKAPLMRVGLIELEKEQHLLILDIHHIIADGLSIGILIEELMDEYYGKELKELKLQYKDYAEWQQRFIQSEEFQRQKEYWVGQFKDGVTKVDMPTDYVRPNVQSFEGENVYFTIDSELTRKLKEVCQETGVTLYMLLISAYQTLLSKYVAQEEIIVGTVAAGRMHADLQNIVGMFVNTLPIKGELDSNKTFREFLGEIKLKILEAVDNQDYPFEELVEVLALPREASKNPLFDTMFVMENVDISDIKLNGLKINPCNVDYPFAKFDMTVSAKEHHGKLTFRWEYVRNLYKKKTIELFTEHYVEILNSIVRDLDQKISDINMLTKKEQIKLSDELKEIKREYPLHGTLQRLFEKQVETNPEKVAVVYEDKSLTYKELNERANQLAHTLQARGIGRECIVGIMVDRSIEMMVGILGVLKAGGAYLPIDSNSPHERIQFMLEDSQSEIILTQTHLIEKLSHRYSVLDLQNPESYSNDHSNPEIINQANDLAYIIYTSGSTGKAKGVLVTHYNVIRLFTATDHWYGFNAKDVWTLFHSYAFDFSVWEIWGALIYGGKLVIVPYEVSRSPEAFYNLLIDQRVTILNQTPSAFRQLTRYEEGLQERGELLLRYVIFGGEALDPKSLKGWMKNHGDQKPQIVNMYGITETTVHVTYRPITLKDVEETVGSVIGKPIPDLQVYLLDSNQQFVPTGVPGEIYVGGEGVTRGYLNRPQLTLERFIKNPFIEQTDAYLYRTGDLGRFTSDGELEYLGRIDQQVKIRGFRIELAEIEQHLRKHESIQEVVVLDRLDHEGNKILAAFLVLRDALTVSQLRKFLMKSLPDYMIPSMFVAVKEMPLTTNGKINRKVLLNLDANLEIGSKYEAPENDYEERLANIWELFLEIENISVTDDFFVLGGDSLKAVILAGRIHQEFNVEIKVQEIFRLSNIRELCKYIYSTELNAFSSIKPVGRKEKYNVSSAQKRIYALSQYDLENTTYQIPNIVIVEGNLDIKRLEDTLQTLIQRHDILRSSFHSIDDKVIQCINDQIVFELERGLIKNKSFEDVIDEFVRPFDLGQAPLIRARVIEFGENQYIFMLDIHHIIADGVSIGIFMKELMELYYENELPALKLQYKDYAEWQQEFIQSEAIQMQKEYWTNRFKDGVPVVELPTDYARPAVQTFDGDRVSFTLNQKLTRKLKEICQETGVTMYMLLMSAYQVWLSKHTGKKILLLVQFRPADLM
ncbi:non-ribosomal peptide synthetase [Bacillus thuringiensis]|uniref:Amino acid adenylation domain-containing protein n=1 Tax=Bacillus thuringiensis TaxID=1428 RepID=A0A9W3V9X8_BACTU|nr:non-ribosomal peptide synthetase [Bacillus thuringiensis]AYF81299.1 amino acid adenylation domain-containing protein [Bacillus thuringiensis]